MCVWLLDMCDFAGQLPSEDVLWSDDEKTDLVGMDVYHRRGDPWYCWDCVGVSAAVMDGPVNVARLFVLCQQLRRRNGHP